MFNDVLNVKEASLENKDFFKGVNRWFWLEKIQIFSLHVFGENKTKNGIIGFSSISPGQDLKQRIVFYIFRNQSVSAKALIWKQLVTWYNF